LIIFRALQLSRSGWAFRALRDDELAAELAGVDVARYRIVAAVVGSAMIGLAGALNAYSSAYISPSTYGFSRVDVSVLVIVAFGGLGMLLAPVLGATAFAVFDEAVASSGQLREVFYGAFIIAIFLGFRRGVAATAVDLVRRLTGRRRIEPALPPPAD
jgi:branched-chain amino acid transport system permease protein